ITLGGSDSSILPSQLASTTRPTVGVDQTSVKLGNCFAVGPHCHFATASSGPAGGWYSQRSTQPASTSPPPSGGHTGGRSRQRPSGGGAWVQPPSSGPPPSPPPPSDGSQYWSLPQSLA